MPFGLLTGQVGYAWNNVLFYVKGGAAVTGDKYEAFSGLTGALLASANETFDVRSQSVDAVSNAGLSNIRSGLLTLAETRFFLISRCTRRAHTAF